ncbi:MAG: PKD domain-containing protein [Gemmatimonadota bacterium]|jgi:hypothetical protein
MKFRLSFAFVALALVAAGCGDDDPAPATTGSIGVTTVTTGDDIDADGYTLSVDGNNAGAIGVNAVVVIPDLAPGTYSVGLSGVADNCAVQNNPRDVDVTAGLTENTQFDVACALLNQPPVADAGADQTVTDADDSGAEDVTLDGSASTDADGTIVSWSWTVDGTEIATGEMATVAFDVGVTTVVLTVTDDEGATGTDNVTITVEAFVGNQAPTADAGPDQTVTDADNSGDEDVTLDGSASADADGTIVSYSWTENAVEIATGETPVVNFAVGAYTVTLTVTDDEGATGTDDVVITVNAPTVFFAADILPYFEAGEANCVQCHAGGTGFAGVNLDSYANILTNGNNGPLVVPGNSADPTAILIPKLNADHQNGPDDAGFATTLATWIDEGALDN